MTGFERLKGQVKDQEDRALVQTVDYLLSRNDMESNYLKAEKTLSGMCDFIQSKARKYMKNGWNYITNEVVYSWAVMYFSLPNSFLKIPTSKNEPNTLPTPAKPKNNVVSLEAAKKNIESKKEKETAQLSLFGGVV